MTSAKTSLKITCAGYLSRVRDVMYTENKLGLLRRKVTEKLERLRINDKIAFVCSCFNSLYPKWEPLSLITSSR